MLDIKKSLKDAFGRCLKEKVFFSLSSLMMIIIFFKLSKTLKLEKIKFLNDSDKNTTIYLKKHFQQQNETETKWTGVLISL